LAPFDRNLSSLCLEKQKRPPNRDFQWLDSKGTVSNIYYAHTGWRRPAQQQSAIIERNSFLVDIIQLPNRNRII
jgi:hypothetical protein